MPIYELINTETQEIFEKIMKLAEYEEFIKENPHIQQMLISAPAMVSSSGMGKMPDGFKEVLSKVGEAHPNSRIGQEYHNKTNAQVKAREIVKKHREKAAKASK